jgi:hypothetical protein
VNHAIGERSAGELDLAAMRNLLMNIAKRTFFEQYGLP